MFMIYGEAVGQLCVSINPPTEVSTVQALKEIPHHTRVDWPQL